MSVDFRNTDLINSMIPKFNNANCLSVGDPELFFPISAEKNAKEQIRAAKRVCENCVHKMQCLDFAVNNEIREGIWGGLSETERRRVIRMRSKVAS